MYEEIILDLYYFQSENEKIKNSVEYYKILDDLTALSDKFDTTISEEQIQKFHDILNLAADLEAEACHTAYLTGFKTAMRIAIETLYDKNNG